MIMEFSFCNKKKTPVMFRLGAHSFYSFNAHESMKSNWSVLHDLEQYLLTMRREPSCPGLVSFEGKSRL